MTKIPVEFEHSDHRRTLKQLFTGDVAQVNLFYAKEGVVLGDHFHKETKEYFHILRGSVIYNDEQVVSKGQTFRVDPNERHKIECLSDVVMMTFLSKPYKKENPDIHV